MNQVNTTQEKVGITLVVAGIALGIGWIAVVGASDGWEWVNRTVSLNEALGYGALIAIVAGFFIWLTGD